MIFSIVMMRKDDRTLRSGNESLNQKVERQREGVVGPVRMSDTHENPEVSPKTENTSSFDV